MGEARRRGTREQRVTQSIERQNQEAVRKRQQYERDEAIRREAEKVRIAALPPQERKEAVFVVGGSQARHRLLTAAICALAMPRVK